MNNKMYKAFTLLEVVFIIVIIGILSSIAISKFSTTRNDAEITAIIANTQKILLDVQAYYTSQSLPSYLAARTPQVTNVTLYLNPTCSTRADMLQRVFVGSTLYLCSGSDALLIINTTNVAQNIQTLTLRQRVTPTQLSLLLNGNATFQTITNGTLGRTYQISNSMIVR